MAYRDVKALENALVSAKAAAGASDSAAEFRDQVIPAMNELRVVVDEMQTVTAKEYWPYPTYGEILFSVR